VNMGYVGDAIGSCYYQTVYGGHEVFEEQTDGVSADCCDAELPGNAPSSCHLVGWCSACTPACAQYNVTGCSFGGYQGNGSFGISHVACADGNTYAYQMVSPGNHEFDGTCTAITIAGVSNCAPYACGSTYYWTCEADGNLHTCNSSGQAQTQSCSGAGCHSTGTCTNDICNTNCTPYACGTTYYWTCETDGNLHSCNSSGNPTVQSCGGNGCHSTGICTNDVCNTTAADAGVRPDAGASRDSGAATDAGTALDAGKIPDGAASLPDAAVGDAGDHFDGGQAMSDSGAGDALDGASQIAGDSGSDISPLPHPGFCGCSSGTGPTGALGLILLVARKARRRRSA
jgi:MYXO-CTERM domain-containing protein